jgi:hypothetical protein
MKLNQPDGTSPLERDEIIASKEIKDVNQNDLALIILLFQKRIETGDLTIMPD